MKRWDKLTAQDVIDAYERHADIQARPGIYVRIQSDSTGSLTATEACAVSVLAIDDGIDFDGFHDPGGQVINYLTHRLPRAFRAGIQYGFDHDITNQKFPYPDDPVSDSRFYRGLAIGRSVREWAKEKYNWTTGNG